jgi:uncharacterized membrane protein
MRMERSIGNVSQRSFTEKMNITGAWKILAWAVVLTIAVYFISRNVLRYYAVTPEVFRGHWSHAGILLTHITGGTLALVLGPFQFWHWLRRNHLNLHRWLGRVYLLCIVASTISASYILTIPESPIGFRTGIGGLALAWIITASLAFIAIRKRQIEQHREWMVRCYVVTFGFVTFRIISMSMAAFNIGTPESRSSAASWMCWALPLLLTETILQGQKIFIVKRA